MIVHAGTNDLTNNTNTLRSVKKLCEKTKKICPNTKIVFSSIIFRKDRRDIGLVIQYLLIIFYIILKTTDFLNL